MYILLKCQVGQQSILNDKQNYIENIQIEVSFAKMVEDFLSTMNLDLKWKFCLKNEVNNNEQYQDFIVYKVSFIKVKWFSIAYIIYCTSTSTRCNSVKLNKRTYQS